MRWAGHVARTGEERCIVSLCGNRKKKDTGETYA